MYIKDKVKAEKVAAVQKTFHEASDFFLRKSVGSGMLETEFNRLARKSIRLSENSASAMGMNGYELIIPVLEEVRVTIEYLDSDSNIIVNIDEVITMLEGMIMEHKLVFI